MVRVHWSREQVLGSVRQEDSTHDHQGPYQSAANPTPGSSPDSLSQKQGTLQAEQGSVSRYHRRAWLCYEQSFRFYD